MIYTVTFNPSLDYIIEVKNFKTGVVNRAFSERIYSGGKGINVSLVLNHLEVKNRAFGFIAGFVGDEIQKRLLAEGCDLDFIQVKQGNSRINIKLNAEEETEINGIGPVITQEELQIFFDKLEQLTQGDFLILAGSIPSCLPTDIYERILAHLEGKGIHFVVDATGTLLQKVLKYQPFLIKPNHHELGELFSKELKTEEEIIICAKELRKMGAKNVLVSRAEKGAILAAEDGNIYKSSAPKGKVIQSVGSGDSMVAGFLSGYLQSGQLKQAFYMGIAAGSASAFSEELATKEQILKVWKGLFE